MAGHPTGAAAGRRRGALGRAAGALSVLGIALAAAVSCGDDEEPAEAPPLPRQEARAPGDPPHAKRAMVDELRRARDRPRSPADGGGRAWIDGPAEVTAGTGASFRIVYEAGELGVARGGYVELVVPPYWFWSDPQMRAPDAPGYTTVTSEPEVEIDAYVADRSAVLARVTGRPLAAGERLAFTYGAGGGLARADRFAERESVFWLRVDGDGDGTSGIVRGSPAVRVLPGPAARLVLTLPSAARPGERVRLNAALLDRFGNAADFAGDVTFPDPPDGLALPERLRIEDGAAEAEVVVEAPGVLRVEAVARADGLPEDAASLRGASNPLECSARAPRILWGDLHGHSNLTDGTGTPEDYLAYARDVAALDVVALTDHDHWGMLPLAEEPDLWERIRAATRDAHEPGRFVTLLGYEWTSWIHGHRHVLYFGDDGPVLSSVDEAFESPLDLWAALKERGIPALTFAHHSAGGPIPTNWDVPPDPELEPVTEIASVHGSSEAQDSPATIYAPVRGNFVRDALDRGYRLGFVGSGDGHDGHPGLAHLASPSGGLAAILSEDLSREGVLAALRARRCYGTNGPRIVLRAALGTARMGETLPPPAADDPPPLLYVHAIGTAPLASIDVVRSGRVVYSHDCGEKREEELALELLELRAGEYVYVRVVQRDRGLAWSSPFFVE